MKVGLIRCMKTEDICVATRDFMVIRNKKGAFKGIKGEIEVIGVTNCGGCPGDKVVTRAQKMVKGGADAIALTSCITKGRPIGSVCPYVEKMKEAIENKLSNTIKLIDYTH